MGMSLCFPAGRYETFSVGRYDLHLLFYLVYQVEPPEDGGHA